MIGETISHYTILDKLGEGGMGVVYRARDLNLDRLVAIKVLSPDLSGDQTAKQRFIHEAKAASSLDHPNICTIHEIGETGDGSLFIAMACYEGETLKQRLERGAPPLDEAIDFAVQIVSGLAKAHEKEIIHRDIKPGNIFITRDGRIKILDFGLAKLSGQTKVTQTGSTVGTVSYMSPEQAQGEETDARSDIFSLGVVLYELFSGALPFSGEHEAAVLYSIVNSDPTSLSEQGVSLPSAIEGIIGKALAKKPEKRYQSTSDLLTELRNFHEKRKAASYAESHGVPTSRAKRSTLWLPVAVILAFVIGFFIVKPMLFESGPVASTKPLIVITFDNQTGDTAYDYLQNAIPNLLISSLEQSKYLSVVTWERLNDLLKQLGKDDAAHIDKETGYELCRLEGIPTIVVGSFAKAGNIFATDVKVLDVDTKELLKSASAKGEGVESILKHQIDDLSKEIARGTGLSDRKIAQDHQPVIEVTTASMDAYHFFLRGLDDYFKMYFQDASRSLQRALVFDSTFASAHLYLSKSHARLEDYREARRSLERANRFAQKATERERLYIEAAYAKDIEKDMAKNKRILNTIIDRYPLEKTPHIFLSITYRNEGKFEKAIAEGKEVLRLDPKNGYIMNQLGYLYAVQEKYDMAIQYLEQYAAVSPGDANPHDSLGEIYFMMGRLDDALAKARETLAIKPDFGSGGRIAYIYALKEEYGEALRWSDGNINHTDHPTMRAMGHHLRGFYLFHLGRLDEALSDYQTALRMFTQAENPAAARVLFSIGQVHHEKGDFHSSKSEYLKCLQAARKSGYAVDVAAVLVYTSIAESFLAEGEIDSAFTCLKMVESQLSAEEEQAPKIQQMLRYTLTIVQAKCHLQNGETEKAIAVCEQGPQLTAPLLRPDYAGIINTPPEQDVYAQALHATGRLDEAIAEYEDLITFDPASRDRRLVNPRYRYRLARLYEEAGRTAEAVAQYERFLEIFEQADPIYTEVEEARRKLAALKQQS